MDEQEENIDEQKENVPDYPSTEYNRLYSTIVNMNWHKSDLAKRVINSSDAEEDWDSETYGRKLNTRNYTVPMAAESRPGDSGNSITMEIILSSPKTFN